AASLVAARILAARVSGKKIRILVTGPTYTAWENLFGEILELLQRLNVTNVACFRIYSTTHTDRGTLPTTANTVYDIEARRNDTAFQAFWGQLQNPQSIMLIGSVAHQCYRIAKQGADTAMTRVIDCAVIDESSQLDVGKSLF